MLKKAFEEKPRRGGRPSKKEAGQLEDKILDAAATLFFNDGYGHVSIEKIAERANISKRTFYARFDNKAAVFRAVVHRVIQRLIPDPAATDGLFRGPNLASILHKVAPLILMASVSPDTVSLLRLVLAEAKRFPEVALIMHERGMRQEAVGLLAAVLEKEAHKTKRAIMNPSFAAEQFLFMLTSLPQRRAMGLGVPMKPLELDQWAKNTVELFMHGYLIPL